MKKTILLIILVISSIAADAQISFAGQIGVNLQVGSDKDDILISNPTAGVQGEFVTQPKAGFMIGFLADITLSKKLGLRPEINFTQKGSSVHTEVNAFIKNWTLNYIELPVNVIYNIKFRRGSKMFFGVGPAVSMGLGGKIKHKDTDTRESAKYKVNFDADIYQNDGQYHLKRYDISANILFGYNFRGKYAVKMGYTHGFIDINPYIGQSYRNRVVNLSIAYILGGKNKG